MLKTQKKWLSTSVLASKEMIVACKIGIAWVQFNFCMTHLCFRVKRCCWWQCQYFLYIWLKAKEPRDRSRTSLLCSSKKLTSYLKNDSSCFTVHMEYTMCLRNKWTDLGTVISDKRISDWFGKETKVGAAQFHRGFQCYKIWLENLTLEKEWKPGTN